MNTANYTMKEVLVLMLFLSVFYVLTQSECQASKDIEGLSSRGTCDQVEDELETVKFIMPSRMTERAKERFLKWGGYVYQLCVTAGYVAATIQIVGTLPGLTAVLGATLLANGTYKTLEAILADHPNNKIYISTLADGAAHLILGVYVITSYGILYQISASTLLASVCLDTMYTPVAMNPIDKFKSLLSLTLGSTLTVSAFTSGAVSMSFLIAGVVSAAATTPGALYSYFSRKMNDFVARKRAGNVLATQNLSIGGVYAATPM
ncbi:MAG: hypothetical protein QS748_10080 [Candidatus Endonucleobacter bathymodioli]|uniref:Uncharacterized protein n=1 Tax=Candidatus Endonucleibacter bathymodioli TaxID=539814 RepID=A0AA90NRZ9_9GAMM|nr:hypothetical protein [Candidatus Endonucleobacter bathymodioli]